MGVALSTVKVPFEIMVSTLKARGFVAGCDMPGECLAHVQAFFTLSSAVLPCHESI